MNVEWSFQFRSRMKFSCYNNKKESVAWSQFPSIERLKEEQSLKCLCFDVCYSMTAENR